MMPLHTLPTLHATVVELQDASNFTDRKPRVTFRVEEADAMWRKFTVKMDSLVGISLGQKFRVLLTEALEEAIQARTPSPTTWARTASPNWVERNVAEAEKAVERVIGADPPAYPAWSKGVDPARYAGYATDGTFSDGSPVMEPPTPVGDDDADRGDISV